jgi:hypothetical protein
METKTVVIAKEGIAKIGSDIIVLKDQSVNKFTTDSIFDFIAFINLLQLLVGKAVVFYSSTQLMLKETAAAIHQSALAVCALSVHPILERILRNTGRALQVKELDEFLFEVRNFYGDVNAKALYDRLQKLVVKKITSMTREKDRSGNYSYSAERKDGEGSVEFPASISFMVPVFEHMEDKKVAIVFDLFIDYKEGEEGPSISFTLKNPLIQEYLEGMRKSIIEEAIKEITLPKLWGTLATIEQTDSWQYQKNGI